MQIDEIEIKLLAEAIFLRYGYDFRGYSEASFRRRVLHVLRKMRLETVASLQHDVLHKPELFATVIPELTVGTSEMFRDPSFYATLREQILPVLKTYPTFKIWHAGCSTGEEVYSLAIMLREAGLTDKAIIYATDINQTALKLAREGIYSIDRMRQFTTNYQKSGGQQTFGDYYTVAYGAARLDPSLRSNIVFFDHNLVTDDVFSETHLILCRNVLIYFNRDLQSRVLDLFLRSLCYKGFLGLGSKESIKFLQGNEVFEDVAPSEKIYRKILREETVGSGRLLS